MAIANWPLAKGPFGNRHLISLLLDTRRWTRRHLGEGLTVGLEPRWTLIGVGTGDGFSIGLGTGDGFTVGLGIGVGLRSDLAPASDLQWEPVTVPSQVTESRSVPATESLQEARHPSYAFLHSPMLAP